MLSLSELSLPNNSPTSTCSQFKLVMKVFNIYLHMDREFKMLGMLLPQHRQLTTPDKLEKPGPIPNRHKNSSDFSKKLPTLQKLIDLMDMLNHSTTTLRKSTTVLTSTTMFLRQDFTPLNLSSTTLNTKLHSLKKLLKLGKKLPPPNKLNNSITTLRTGLKLTSSKTSTTKLNKPERLPNNTLLFQTFPHLGKTKFKEELNST